MPKISVVFYIVVLPLSIVVAFFLLKYKNWARAAIIIISIAVAVESIVTIPQMRKYTEKQVEVADKKGVIDEMMVGIKKNINREIEKQRQIDPGRAELIAQSVVSDEELRERSREFLKQMMMSFIYALIGFIVFFNLLALYYFTRPGVRKRFKMQELT